MSADGRITPQAPLLPPRPLFKKQPVITTEPVITPPALEGTAGARQGVCFSAPTGPRAAILSSLGGVLMSFAAGSACWELPNRLPRTSWALCLNPALGILRPLFAAEGSRAFSINGRYLEVSGLKKKRKKEKRNLLMTRAAHLEHTLSCTS